MTEKRNGELKGGKAERNISELLCFYSSKNPFQLMTSFCCMYLYDDCVVSTRFLFVMLEIFSFIKLLTYEININ